MACNHGQPEHFINSLAARKTKTIEIVPLYFVCLEFHVYRIRVNNKYSLTTKFRLKYLNVILYISVSLLIGMGVTAASYIIYYIHGGDEMNKHIMGGLQN